MPANSEPIITAWAPAASALVTSPENLMPPSAITGMSCSAAAATQSWMAVIWGSPAPVTTRVVQIEPGPMPTLTASTSLARRSAAPSRVATLPAMSRTSGKVSRSRSQASRTPRLWAWEESSTRTSTLEPTSSAARSR